MFHVIVTNSIQPKNSRKLNMRPQGICLCQFPLVLENLHADILIVPRHAIAERDEPQKTLKKDCVGGYGCFFSEQFRTSVAVTKLTYIYWSPNLLRCSYTDILKPVLPSFRRFTSLRIGEECLHGSHSPA